MPDLSEIFSHENLPELTSGKTLQDKDLLVDPATLGAEGSLSIENEDVTFSIGASSGLVIQLFNDEDDVDDEELINVDAPFIPVDYGSQAFLKYSLFVNPKAKGSATLKDVGFEFDADRIIETGLYAPHSSTDGIGNAVASDIATVKTIFKWSDVEGLEDKKSLYFLTRGNLTGKVSVSWSDILSKSLNSLGALLQLPEDISLDISLSPSFAASYQIQVKDDFLYAIHRNEDRFDVKVTKAISTDQSAKMSASVGAAFANPEELEGALETLVDKIIESATGYAKDKVSELIDKAIQGLTNDGENETITEIIDRLDLEEELDPFEAVQEYLDKIEEKAKEVIETIAKANVKLSFSYEYQRISTKKELLLASFNTETLKAYHGDFLRFKLGAFVDNYPDLSEAQVALKQYLNEKTITLKKSWGFGFSFGKKTLFSGKDYSNTNETVRKNIQGGQQVALDTTRGYEGKLGSTEKWMGTIAAEMQSFSVSGPPKMREFQYSMSLQMQTIAKITSGDQLIQFLDLGVLWGALDASEIERLVEKYLDTLAAEDSVSLEAKINFTDTAFQAMIHNIGINSMNETNMSLLAKALAGGMDQHNDFPELESVETRIRSYAPVWKFFLEKPKKSNSTYRKAGVTQLKNLGIGSRAKLLEDTHGISPILKMNPNTYKDLSGFMLGITDLSKGIRNNVSYQGEIEESMEQIQRFFKQSHYVRSAGAFFNQYLEQNAFLQEKVERILTITYGEGDGETAINIAKG